MSQIGLHFAVGSATFTAAQLPAGRMLEGRPALAMLASIYLARAWPR